MIIKINALNELRKILIRIFASDCMCGAGNPDDWVYKLKDSNYFCHDENCHRVIVSQLLGYKLEKR